jgi:hypothetical protein
VPGVGIEPLLEVVNAMDVGKPYPGRGIAVEQDAEVLGAKQQRPQG